MTASEQDTIWRLQRRVQELEAENHRLRNQWAPGAQPRDFSGLGGLFREVMREMAAQLTERLAMEGDEQLDDIRRAIVANAMEARLTQDRDPATHDITLSIDIPALSIRRRVAAALLASVRPSQYPPTNNRRPEDATND